MNQEAIKALSDSLLEQVSGWAQDELKVRAEKRRQDTIVKIKAMAAAAGVVVNIGGARGRPAKVKTDEKGLRHGQA